MSWQEWSTPFWQICVSYGYTDESWAILGFVIPLLRACAVRRPPLAEANVVAAGGGPAGLGAAIAASRMGARTLLVERYGFLGGNRTVGGVNEFGAIINSSSILT